MKRLNQQGFHLIAIIIVLAVLGIIGFVGMRVLHKSNSNSSESPDSARQIASLKSDCTGDGPVDLTHSPMDLSDVGSIIPIGTLAGAHVTPIDHLYFYPKDMKNRDAAPVYAMADGYIVSYQERTQKVDNGASQKGEYRLDIQHTCSFFTYFDLITSLDKDLAAQIQAKGGKDLHIPIKAGQVIGRVGAQSLDTAVYNYDLTLKGFVNPKSYESESWKLHTDDFFKYFKNPLKDQMLALNPRKVEPYGGKIDYDIDGKLIGNWFQEGTNGYAGLKEQQGRPGSDGKGYWSGHFSIAPDAINPNVINISFGDYNGRATQFSAKTGSPDPATVGQDNGVVKYELVQYSNASPSPTGGVMESNQQVTGTVLFQLTGTQKLKLEAFPGKTASQVTGFTGAAKTYVR